MFNFSKSLPTTHIIPQTPYKTSKRKENNTFYSFF
jgi:hypothetical protein